MKRATSPTAAELAIIAASLSGGDWEPLYHVTKAHELWIAADLYLLGLENESTNENQTTKKE